MPYATSAEVKTYTGNAGLDETRLTMLCEMASAAIDFEIGRPLTQASRTDTVRGTGTSSIFVHWPVVSVESVSVDGTVLGVDDYGWWPTGELGRRCWSKDAQVEVTYTCGFDPADPAFAVAKTVCMQAVSDQIDNPNQLSQETVGDWSRSWSAKAIATSMLSDSARAQLARLVSRIPPR